MQWFDDTMDRLSGWYKRNVQLVLFALGLAFAAALNVSTIEIARALWTQPLLRDVVVQSASKFYDENRPTNENKSADVKNDDPRKRLDEL